MMHVLNPLPDLLNYSLFAPTILRIVFGAYLIMFGYAKVAVKKGEKSVVLSGAETKKLFPSPPLVKTLGVIEFIVGIAFVIGLYVQIDSIIAIVIFLAEILLYDKFNPPKKISKGVLLLFLVIALSLLLSGAGKVAIDWPL